METLIVGVFGGSWGTTRVFAFADSTPDSQVTFANGFASVAKKALPAVVNIASSKTVRFP
jgi:S1-C subfamily serine protease